MDCDHVLVIIQCQTDGCSLGCKDGAVVWQSFGQLAVGCLTILEMAVDDRRCPYSLVHFGAISIDFIMWSLCFTILIELSLGFLSGDLMFKVGNKDFALCIPYSILHVLAPRPISNRMGSRLARVPNLWYNTWNMSVRVLHHYMSKYRYWLMSIGLWVQVLDYDVFCKQHSWILVNEKGMFWFF